MDQDETAGSVAASESHNDSGQHGEEGAEESLAQQGGSVNWGQATAQSPRVPRSQISRAHPAHHAAGYGERTSAVLSALSGDDETALSAAEAAGEHTSEPQEGMGGVGEAQGEAGGGGAVGGAGTGGASGAGGAAAAAAAGAPPHAQHPHYLQQQLPALSLTAPVARGRGGFELASSPPASTSPIYRANSVVSYTAAPTKPGQHATQPLATTRRGVDTPASAPAAAQLLGSSPNTSRGEFSAALPRAPRRGTFSAGLPPTSGQRPGSGHQQQHHHHHHHHGASAAAGPQGPSRPSLSGTQSHADPVAAVPTHSLPSTMAVALGAFSPSGGGLLAQLSSPHGGLALPTPSAPPAAGFAGLLPLAASMGIQPAQLNSMAAALLQAQSSVLGTHNQQQQQQQQQSEQQPLLAQQQQQQPGSSHAGAVMPPPPPLQVLQQAEALQNMAAMLQAQASAIMSGAPAVPHGAAGQQQPSTTQPAAAAAPTPATAMLSPAAAAQQQQQQQQQGAGALPMTSEAGQPYPAASQGAASVQSLPSLVGASAIQGHPLPPPAFYRGAGATTPVPLQSFGGTPAPPAAAAAAPRTVQSGAFPAPGPLAAAATPLQVAAAVSEMQGSAIQPAVAALMQQQEALAAGGANAQAAKLAAPMQQATSAVLGSGNGAAGSQLLHPSPSSADPEQAAAETERRRHAADPPQPQAATIQELPTADVAAASQGGGAGGAPAAMALPPAVPQEAAMLGGNSAFGDQMELGVEDEDAMEVQQEAAGGRAGRQNGQLPPAPHGAASVMATLMTDNGGGGRSEGDMEMEQQAASGPSQSAAAAAQPAQSLSRSMAEPAAATAHITGAPSAHTAATQPSQQGPATSNQGQLAHALSSLATVSTGNGERAGGSVEMSALPSPLQAQHATSAPAVFPAGPGAPPHAAALMGECLGEEAASPAAGMAALLPHPPVAQPAASAPAAVPPQLPPQPSPAGMGMGLQSATLLARPAASASMSGQGDTPGLMFQYGSTAGMAVPQSSAALGPPPGTAAATAAAQQYQQHQYQHHHQHQQQQQHYPFAAPGAQHQQHQQQAAPALASLCEGQNDGGGEPMTDARSRRQGASMTPAAAAPPAPAAATIEGMGSPTASMHAAQPRESQGTARATILAGAAHSILTTAAAGEGEAMDEGGEALSPLLAGKGLHMHAHAPTPASAWAGHAAAGPAMMSHVAAAAAAAPLPGSGSVGGTPQPPAASAVPAPGGGVGAGAAEQPYANGFAKSSEHGAGALAAGGGSRGFASPIDLSTMAVDLAPLAGGRNGASSAQPQPSASGQPSSLPPPAAVAAALAALEQQQAAMNGSSMQTPPPVPAELGEMYHVLQQQNGYATYANSAIGNGHVAQSSPERELTSPSRLLTHDSTGSGSHRQHSKQTAKRRRTSVGPAGSSQHA